MNEITRLLLTPWGLAITAIVILGAFAWWVLTNPNLQSEKTVGRVLMNRLIVLILLVACIGIGYLLPRSNAGRTSTSESQTEQLQDPVASQDAGAATEQHRQTTSTRLLRILLWINITLALPWITAFATRHVLAKRSNALSFTLLTGYTAIDIVLAMLVGGLAFVGIWGVSRLAGILLMSAGYNYWACETVAALWGDVSSPRRRTRA